MRREIVFASSARLEFEDAVAWYDSQRAGLGEEFRIEVRDLIEQILAIPTRFRLASHLTRKATLRRFPYSIFYSVEPRAINVVAIFHGARNPAELRRRLK